MPFIFIRQVLNFLTLAPVCSWCPRIASWSNNTGWPTDWSTVTSVNQAADWYGITVENGDVTAINLDNNGLNGIIPTSFTGLTELRVLRMDHNSLGNMGKTFAGFTTRTVP